MSEPTKTEQNTDLYVADEQVVAQAKEIRNSLFKTDGELQAKLNAAYKECTTVTAEFFANPNDVIAKEKLDKVNAAFDALSAERKNVRGKMQDFQFEDVAERPVSVKEFENFRAEMLKNSSRQVPIVEPGTYRQGFGEEDLTNAKTGIATMKEALQGIVGSIFDAGHTIEEIVSKEKNYGNAGVIKMKFRWGNHVKENAEKEARNYVDMNNGENRIAIKERAERGGNVIKSGFTNNPGNTGFPFNDTNTLGWLGFMCGWEFVDRHCWGFEDDPFWNGITHETVQNVKGVLFERQLTGPNTFAPVLETYGAQLANKPFWDYGKVVIAAPRREIAGLFQASEAAFQNCPMAIADVTAAGKYFLKQTAIAQLLKGNGTSPNLNGFVNQAGINRVFRVTAPAQASDQMNNEVNNAIAVISLQQRGCKVDSVMVNPLNLAALRNKYGADGHPLFPNCGDNVFCVDNVNATPNMDAGTMLVYDKSQFIVRDQGEIDVTIGYMNDDLRQNRRTIRFDYPVTSYVCDPLCVDKTTGIV